MERTNGRASLPQWLEHLSHDDLDLLERVAPEVGVEPGAVRADDEALTRVLSHRAAFEAVFTGRDGEALLRGSPFLVFALVVHRGWVELAELRHVHEWVGARQRLPVLGGDDLRTFLAARERRLFLTELLASYTRVVSGTTWVHTRRGWRRRRWSELDPVHLAELLDAVPEVERPGVYRRLGDLALFLTGVFPDHTELHGLGPLAEGRLLRRSGLPVASPEELLAAPGSRGAVGLLERLGERWYRLAARTAAHPLTGSVAVVADVAEHFGPARRTLNFLTDRHLLGSRTLMFGTPDA